MKKLVIAGGLLAVGALCLQDISSGHGGTYRGPGDTVPPGGGGTTGGGPSTPGTGGPSTPGPSGPTTPGPATPGTPGGAPSGPRGPATQGGGTDNGPDLTLWQYWWGFNKEPYINLKSHIHTGTAVTGSDDFFLGQGEKGQARDNLRPSDDSVRTKVVPALINSLHTERSNDIVTALSSRVAELSKRVTQLQADLEAAQRRVAIIEEYDATAQEALASALRAAYEIRERAEATASQILEQAREERRMLLKEIERLREEHDQLQDDIAQHKTYYNYQNQDFPREEAPGASVFYKNADGSLFHTYSTYGRGLDILLGAYNFLDMAPKGRDEDGLDFTMSWVRHHDRYPEEKAAVTQKGAASCCGNESHK